MHLLVLMLLFSCLELGLTDVALGVLRGVAVHVVFVLFCIRVRAEVSGTIGALPCLLVGGGLEVVF